jgi:hypothetical protein
LRPLRHQFLLPPKRQQEELEILVADVDVGAGAELLEEDNQVQVAHLVLVAKRLHHNEERGQVEDKAAVAVAVKVAVEEEVVAVGANKIMIF